MKKFFPALMSAVLFISCQPPVTPREEPKIFVPVVLNPGDFYFTVSGTQVPVFGRNVTGNKLEHYVRVFTWMEAAGNKLARVHISKEIGTGWTSSGQVDPYWLEFWEKVFQAAEDRGISLIPVFTAWSDWRNEGGLWEGWHLNPLNKAKGGPADSPTDLLKDTETRRIWLGWMRTLVERWQGRRNVAAWEIFSEMNLISGTSEALSMAFYQEARGIIRKADPLDRPIYASLAGVEVWKDFFAMPEMDIVQVHPYGDVWNYNLDEKLLSSVKSLRLQFRKPVLIGECDLDVGGQEDTHRLNESPDAARGLTLALWSNVFAGGMGTRFFWFNDSHAVWDEANFGLDYIEPKKDLEASLRKFLQGMDFAGMEPIPGVTSPGLTGSILARGGEMAGWFKSSGVKADFWTPAPVTSPKITVNAAPEGTWKVDYISTADGVSVLKSESATTTLGALVLSPPDFGFDTAFKARRTDGPEDYGRALVRVVPEGASGGSGPVTVSTIPALNALSLNDQGLQGDELSGDGIWTVTIRFPAAGAQSLQIGKLSYTFTPAPGRLDLPDLRWEATGQGGTQALYYRGTTNSWGSQIMHLQADGTWYLDLELEASPISYKFCRDSQNWELGNWGDNEADGTVESYGANMTFTPPSAGRYRLTYSETAKTYFWQASP